MSLHLRPNSDEYSSWYQNYIERVKSEDVISALEDSKRAMDDLWPRLIHLPPGFAYAEGKWSVSRLMRHIVDSEWIFAYRALRFARNDKTELPGYDHDAYADQTTDESLHDLYAQFQEVRSATIGLFRSFPETTGTRSGTANGNLCSVRALGFIIAGHQLHHLDILSARYLSEIDWNG